MRKLALIVLRSPAPRFSQQSREMRDRGRAST